MERVCQDSMKSNTKIKHMMGNKMIDNNKRYVEEKKTYRVGKGMN